ncbi:MAG: STAS domain-containing protein [Leptospiraceae bacterium]|nr:STAS domain-containing protein [Leptospiraceae bacterium]MDW7977113.1 STAS domain-containing protein [Leptospiraceae bacterium]
MIKTRYENDILVIETEEQRLDMVVARKFKDKLSEAIQDKPKKIILNLAKTNYFDSSALGALVSFLKDVKTYNGHLVLCNLSRSLMALLKLSKLDILFEIKDSEQEAIQHYNDLHPKKK